MTTNWPTSADTVASLRPPGEVVQGGQQMLMNVAAAVAAIEASLVAGGTPLDSLTLADFIAIGAAAASAGAVRLESGAAVNARNAADDADLEIASVVPLVDGMTTYDLYQLFGGKLVFDPDDSGTLAVLNFGLAVSAQNAYDPATIGSDQAVALTTDSVTAGKTGGAAGRISGNATTAAVDAVSPDGSHRFTATVQDASLVVLMKGLPTADPLVAGVLWNDTGVLTVSAG